MRLDKTGYLFGEKTQKLDANGKPVTDSLGRPVYVQLPNIPFDFAWEPFSAAKSSTAYGTSVTCRYRMFIYPDDRLDPQVQTAAIQFVYDGFKYEITSQIERFDDHYEILVDLVGAYTS